MGREDLLLAQVIYEEVHKLGRRLDRELLRAPRGGPAPAMGHDHRHVDRSKVAGRR